MKAKMEGTNNSHVPVLLKLLVYVLYHPSFLHNWSTQLNIILCFIQVLFFLSLKAVLVSINYHHILLLLFSRPQIIILLVAVILNLSLLHFLILKKATSCAATHLQVRMLISNIWIQSNAEFVYFATRLCAPFECVVPRLQVRMLISNIWIQSNADFVDKT